MKISINEQAEMFKKLKNVIDSINISKNKKLKRNGDRLSLNSEQESIMKNHPDYSRLKDLFTRM